MEEFYEVVHRNVMMVKDILKLHGLVCNAETCLRLYSIKANAADSCQFLQVINGEETNYVVLEINNSMGCLVPRVINSPITIDADCKSHYTKFVLWGVDARRKTRACIAVFN